METKTKSVVELALKAQEIEMRKKQGVSFEVGLWDWSMKAWMTNLSVGV